MWKVQIPTPSAKRLEKDRTMVVEEHGAFHSMKHRFPIPEGDTEFVFDFAFEEDDPHINEYILDASVTYNCYVEYKNSTGSRVEQIPVELEQI